ncbi:MULTISPECIES: cell division regulator GpsB [unclassified Aerococcus]|uniref:cell division regulator GpsB n=1 Tax=unclassified Aerococcus TaxID=2618060 RepID=UPI0025BBD532|nr:MULTISPECIES: cell division regulator GpsB [unclassified Aerococcus]
MADRNLTTKDILQKEFKPALRGFNTEEVDEFLDLIIRDYESYEKEIASLKNELERAKHSTGLSESGRQATNQRSKSTTVPQSKGTTNYDILRRLSKLEKAVFGGQNAKAENTVDASEDNENDTKDHTIIFENN